MAILMAIGLCGCPPADNNNWTPERPNHGHEGEKTEGEVAEGETPTEGEVAETFTITVTVIGQGIVTGNAESYSAGSVANLIATPSTGWRFNYFFIDGQIDFEEMKNLTVNSNQVVIAVFVEDPAIIGEGEEVLEGETPTEGENLTEGEIVEGEAIIEGETVTEGEGETPIISHSITISQVGQGTVIGAGTYVAGTDVTIAAISDSGWSFVAMIIDGDAYSEAAKTVAVNANMTIVVVFTKNPVVVEGEGEAGIEGEIPTEGETPTEGENLTEREIVEGEGESQILFYDVTVTIIGNGSVIGAGTYVAETSATLAATPDSGWEFNCLIVDEVVHTDPIIEVPITGDINVTVIFTEVSLTEGEQPTEGENPIEGEGEAIAEGEIIEGEGEQYTEGEIEGTAPVIIVAPPITQTVTVGSSVTLSVVAESQDPITYQWWASLDSDFAIIFGANSSSLTIDNVTQNDGGWYNVVVCNRFGFVQGLAQLIVIPNQEGENPIEGEGEAIIEGETSTEGEATTEGEIAEGFIGRITFGCPESGRMSVTIRLAGDFALAEVFPYIDYIGVAGPNGNWGVDQARLETNSDITEIENLSELSTSFESWLPNHFRGNLFWTQTGSTNQDWINLDYWEVRADFETANTDLVIPDGGGGKVIDFTKTGDCL